MGDLKDMWEKFKKEMEKANPGLVLSAKFIALFPGKAEEEYGSIETLIAFLENFPEKKEEQKDG